MLRSFASLGFSVVVVGGLAAFGCGGHQEQAHAAAAGKGEACPAGCDPAKHHEGGAGHHGDGKPCDDKNCDGKACPHKEGSAKEGSGKAAGGEHHGAPGSLVSQFHDVLAPLWHAPEGDKRVQDTCAAAASMHGLATKMTTDGAPAGASPAYGDQAKALEAAVGTLEAACATPDKKDFAAAFTALHEAFHAVAESSGS